MKYGIVSVVLATLMFGLTAPSYASDWDKAGKALAIIEGARVLTGGNIDLIGNIVGIGRNSWAPRPSRNAYRTYARAPRHYPERVWVPHYVWKKKFIPEHEEYDGEYGTVIVEGHHITYRAEEGGHWE